jgi:hypothetical protein
MRNVFIEMNVEDRRLASSIMLGQFQACALST